MKHPLVSLITLTLVGCASPAHRPPTVPGTGPDPTSGLSMETVPVGKLALLQTEALATCEGFTRSVPGPIWRELYKRSDTVEETNLMGFGALLPDLAGHQFSPYTSTQNTSVYPQARMMVSDYLQPLKLNAVNTVTQLNQTVEMQGRLNAGLMYDTQTSQYWAFTETGNYRERTPTGEVLEAIAHRQVTQGSKAVRFPGNQTVTLSHHLGPVSQVQKEIEVEGQWVKVTVPVRVSTLTVQASTYYTYDVVNGKPTNPVRVTGSTPPLTLTTVVPYAGKTLQPEHHIGFQRGLYYHGLQGKPAGSPELASWLQDRTDQVIGLSLTGFTGTSTVDLQGKVTNVKSTPVNPAELGNPSAYNTQNCLSSHLYAAGSRHDVVTPKATLPAVPLPLVNHIKVQPLTSVQLLVGKNTTLTGQAFHPSGKVLPARVAWSSSNTQVAQIENGTIQGRAAGQANIYASLGGKYQTVEVNVKSGIVQATPGPLAAAGLRSYVIKNDGYVYAFGNGTLLGLGESQSGKNINTPTRISSIKNALRVEANEQNTFVVTTEGNLWGWGDNTFGQLGNGNKITQHIPSKIPITDVVAVTSCFSNTFALKNDGTVWAWGDNSARQLSTIAQDTLTTPVAIPGLSRIKQLTCFAGVDLEGRLYAYDPAGRNYRQLLTGLKSFVSGNSVFAVKTDHTVLGWGFNYDPNLVNNPNAGWLGVGTKTPTYDAPVAIPGLSNVKDLQTLGGSSYALSDAGQLYAWGNNHYGQLGIGSMMDQGTPLKLNLGQSITAVRPGNYHTLALDSNGRLWSWGVGASGQLGYTASGLQKTPKMTSITGIMQP